MSAPVGVSPDDGLRGLVLIALDAARELAYTDPILAAMQARLAADSLALIALEETRAEQHRSKIHAPGREPGTGVAPR